MRPAEASEELVKVVTISDPISGVAGQLERNVEKCAVTVNKLEFEQESYLMPVSHWFLACLFFNFEDGGGMFFLKVS
jgi:hypothetical protein